METPEEKNEQLKLFLHEAVDILDDVKHKLGMFQTQRYYRLKKDIEQTEKYKSVILSSVE